MLDVSQISQPPREADHRPAPVTTMRLRNPQTGVQIRVSEAKAKRLIAEGSYKPVSKAVQPKPPAKQPADENK